MISATLIKLGIRKTQHVIASLARIPDELDLVAKYHVDKVAAHTAAADASAYAAAMASAEVDRAKALAEKFRALLS